MYDIRNIRTGMLVRTMDNCLRIVLGNTLVSLNSSSGGIPLYSYDLNLKTARFGEQYQINEIYSEPNPKEEDDDWLAADMNHWRNGDNLLYKNTLLWKRNDK